MYKSKRFAFVQDFLVDESSKTGYAITFLIDGRLEKFEASKELYESQFRPEYIFPLITETPHLIVFNDDGTATALERFSPGENCFGTFAFGEPKTCGYLATVEGRSIRLHAENIKKELENGCMRYYGAYYHGGMEPVGDEDKLLPLTDGAVIHCMNFVGGARKHEVVSLDFLADILNNRKNCYWLSLYNLYGTSESLDCVCFFLHAAKDPNGKGGDMDKTTLTVEERRAEALTTEPQPLS